MWSAVRLRPRRRSQCCGTGGWRKRATSALLKGWMAMLSRRGSSSATPPHGMRPSPKPCGFEEGDNEEEDDDEEEEDDGSATCSDDDEEDGRRFLPTTQDDKNDDE